MDLASAEGLVNLTIGRLARKSSLSKSGLYAHFGSKTGLQLAVVAAARERFISTIVDPVMTVPRGLPMLAALLQSWLRYIEGETFRGGCFFFAVSAEFDDRPGVVRNQIAAATKEWIVGLESEGGQARTLGHLRSDTDISQLVFEAHALVQEANWAFRLHADDRAFNRAQTGISRRLVEAASPAGGRLLRKFI